MNQSYARLTDHTDPQGALCSALNNYRIIEVSGVDTEKFLQGQLSCDIRKLAEVGHLPGAHCNIKGHMISLYRLFFLSSENIWLRVHESIAQSAFDTLKKYSVFSKVQLRFADELSGVALDAQTRQQLLSQMDAETGDQSLCVIDQGVVALYDKDLTEVWAQDNYLAELLEGADLKGTPESRWLLANIDRGLVDLRAETQEHFIPQMTNLQAVLGVSFNKGCYTGQEIVTRLQHRGILKRAMYRFSAQTLEAVVPGSALTNSEGAAVAEVVLAANDGKQTKILAVVQQSQIDLNNSLYLESGVALSFDGLPYELDPELFQKKR